MGDEHSLEDLGLDVGETVRWQRKAGGHWQQGVVIRREADGSVAVHDSDGAWRSIVGDRLEVQRRRGRRNRLVWEPVIEQVGQPSQLSLWS